MNLQLILDPIHTLMEAEAKPSIPSLTLRELRDFSQANREFPVKVNVNDIANRRNTFNKTLPEDRAIVKTWYKVKIKRPSKIPSLEGKFPSIYDEEGWIVGESVHFGERLYDHERTGEELQFNPEYKKRVCATIVHYIASIPPEKRLNKGNLGSYLAISTYFEFTIPIILSSENNGTLWKVTLNTLLGDSMPPKKGDPFFAVESKKKLGKPIDRI
jgi:hypothetical protein